MSYHSSLSASLGLFELISSESSTMALTLKKLIGEVGKRNPSDAETASQLHHRLDSLFGDLVEIMADFATLDTPPVEIPWLEPNRSKLDMTYISGCNPWEFFLSYTDKDKMTGIHQDLEAKYNQNGLRRFVTPPKEGDFIVCHVGKKWVRAQVLKCFPNGRLRVLKIDSYEEELVQCSNVYLLPKEIAAIPCQALKCCVNKEDQYLTERWVKDLELVFSKTLTECRLTVDILEKLNCFSPPKFHVRIYIYNDELQEEKNLSSWINERLLPGLKLLSPDGIDDIMAVLDEECLDPFYSGRENIDDNKTLPTPTNLNQNVGFSSPNDVAKGSALEMEELNVRDEPDPRLIKLSVEKVSTWMDLCSGDKTIESKRTTSKYEFPKLEEPFFSKAKTSRANDAVEVGSDSNRRNPQSSINGQAASSSTSTHSGTPVRSVDATRPTHSLTKSHSASVKVDSSSSSSRQLDKQRTKTSTLSENAPEFVPSCYVKITPGTNEESFENIISNLEDEYQPKDEKRVCLFYQKRGFCNRIACTKEHIKKTGKWTDDVAEIERGMYNHIDLPQVGCETIIRIQHVENANTFFSTLHEMYSDINEHGVLETLESLYEDLNSCDSTSPHPLLETLPAMTEPVLAMGLQRSLGPGRKWLRAKVTEIRDSCTVEVFFTDFGNKEIVPTKDVRQIRPQFLHLPAQAVWTKLSMTQIIPEQRQPGKVFLSQVIKGKTMKAKIESRDVLNTEMEVILYTEDDICVNNLMVDRGFCAPI